MYLELTQLEYIANFDNWYPLKITITTKAVVGFYAHPELDGTCVVLLANQEPILVQETYDNLRKLFLAANAPKEEEKPKKNVWISCEDHLPDRDGSYLITTNRLSYSVDIGIFKDGRWRTTGTKVIAWMDVPRPSWYQDYVQEDLDV